MLHPLFDSIRGGFMHLQKAKMIARFIEAFEKLIVPIALSVMGGSAEEALMRNRRRKRKLIMIFTDLIVWIYVGIVSYFVLENYPEISKSWKAVIISGVGFSSKEIMMIFKKNFVDWAMRKFAEKSKKINGNDI